MDLSEINPFPRTTGFFENWIYDDWPASVACDLRVFAFLKSSARIELSGGTICVPADSLLLLAPGEPYHFRNGDPEKPFTLYCLSFDLTQEYRNTSRFRLPVHPETFQAEFLVDQKIRDGARDISNLFLPRIVRDCPDLCGRVMLAYRLFQEKPIYYLERCSGIIKDLLFASPPGSTGSEAEQRTAGGAVHARRALSYIDEHFREPISEKSVAAALNFHPYYLARLTKRYFGVTPYRYLTQRRVEEAIRLLSADKTKTIGDIAAACGFAGPSHFSSAIRRETGMSPRELRKNLYQ